MQRTTLPPMKGGLKRRLRQTSGVIDLASIMVGVIIAGILSTGIVATTFALVPFSQDAAAKKALDSASTAEGAAYVAGDQGRYLAMDDLVAGKWIQASAQTVVGTDADGTCYAAMSLSATGNRFWTDNSTSDIVPYVAGTSASDCLDLDALSDTLVSADSAAAATGVLDAVRDAEDVAYADAVPNEYVDMAGLVAAGLLDESSTTVVEVNPDASGFAAMTVTGSGAKFWTDSGTSSVLLYVAGESVSAFYGLADLSAALDAANPVAAGPGSGPGLDTILFEGRVNTSPTVLGPTDLYSVTGTTVTPVTHDLTDWWTEQGAQYGDKMYFLGNSTATGYSLFSFDGTNIAAVPGANGLAPSMLTVFNGKLYFVDLLAETSSGYPAIWSYDGVSAPVKELTKAVRTASAPTHFPVGAGKMLWFDTSGVMQSYDGTTVTAVTDAVATSFNKNNPPVELDGKLYSKYTLGDGSTKISVYDGTTTTVLDLGAVENPGDVNKWNGDLYFTAADPAGVHNLWKHDGVTATSTKISNFDSDFYFGEFQTIDSGLTFTRDDGVTGEELRYYNGSEIAIVADLMPGTAGYAYDLISVGSAVYANWEDPDGRYLWRFDGTTHEKLNMQYPVPLGAIIR